MLKKYLKLYFRACELGLIWLLPIVIFLERFWIARVFWYSGRVKITDWNATMYLFEHEYQTPCFSPEVAAYCTTSFELICSALLFFGIATRLATLPLLAMVAMIQYIYPAEINIYWALMLGTILFYGPGYLSIDALIKRVFFK